MEGNLSEDLKKQLSQRLSALGFELIDSKKSRIIERMKNAIIDLVHYQDNQIQTNLSVFLAELLLMDYNYLSNLFSEVEGVSIEHFYIAQKIERVKELLMYDELTLSEIAFQLNFSDPANFGSFFKKHTGLTPLKYRKQAANN